MPSVVLVTGVSKFLGGHLAARLAADPAIDRVLGVDTVPPPRDLLRRMGRAEFVRADIRNPLIAKVISQASVDTVVHASLSANPSTSGGRTAMKEMNVIGTMQLLAACQKAPTVRRLVLKSTTAVYGSSPRDPALFDEAMTPKDLPSGGYAKDAVEIEGYLRGFAAAGPTSRSRCCGSPTSSARASTPCSPATSRCPSCPRCWATTPACSSCTRRTRSRCWSAPRATSCPARSTSPPTAC